MATTSSPLLKLLSVLFILITVFNPQTLADCKSKATDSCNNKEKALRLKIIAIFSILITSMIGVCLPLFTRSVPFLRPESNLFIVLKCFAAGIILGTGFVHVLPDSFYMPWSDCLQQKPWHEFPFAGLVAMFSAIITLMLDSMATIVCSRKGRSEVQPGVVNESGAKDQQMGTVNLEHIQHHHHHQGQHDKDDSRESELLRLSPW